MAPEPDPSDKAIRAVNPEGFFVVGDTAERTLRDLAALAADRGIRMESRTIGASREGRDLWGIVIGEGRRSVSLTAGAHADEPIGPVTALTLARALIETADGRERLRRWRFFICPQVNPDGAERNRSWFADPPDSLAYLERAVRELPGDDIEFGYPRRAGFFGAPENPGTSSSLPALRPENAAVAAFLRDGAPFAYHASLHGMGFSEGAWFLIGREWAERAVPLMDLLERRIGGMGWTWHDIDRRGKKGFERIRRGFCTTPTHVAMREFFLKAGDRSTAAKFHPNSMEFIRSLGGDPLVMVSELPLFRIGVPYAWPDAPGEGTPYLRFRRELGAALGDTERVGQILAEFEVTAVPVSLQVETQMRMVFSTLDFLEGLGEGGRSVSTA